MKQWEALLGVALMLMSLAAMVVWEGWGRDALLLTEVVVTAKPIAAGELVRIQDLTVLGVPEDCIVAGAIPAEKLKELKGLYTVNSLSANQQVCMKDFVKEDQLVKGEETTFVIPVEWIEMRSSSLRRGDRVTLHRLTDYASLGTYTVAFVKDDRDQEVFSLEGVDDRKLLERTDSNLEIHHLEIIAKLEEYQIIRQAALQDGGLLVVQEVTQ